MFIQIFYEEVNQHSFLLCQT